MSHVNGGSPIVYAGIATAVSPDKPQTISSDHYGSPGPATNMSLEDIFAPNATDESIERSGNLFNQLDSMIAAVQVESSALDTMREKLKELDTLRNQLTYLTKRLLEADQTNLALKSNLMSMQESYLNAKKAKSEIEGTLNPVKNELARTKDVLSKERMAKVSVQQEAAMLKEHVQQLEKSNEDMERDLKTIPALRESNEILKADMAQLRQRHKSDRQSLQHTIKTLEAQKRELEGSRNEIRNLAFKLVELSGGGHPQYAPSNTSQLRLNVRMHQQQQMQMQQQMQLNQQYGNEGTSGNIEQEDSFENYDEYADDSYGEMSSSMDSGNEVGTEDGYPLYQQQQHSAYHTAAISLLQQPGYNLPGQQSVIVGSMDEANYMTATPGAIPTPFLDGRTAQGGGAAAAAAIGIQRRAAQGEKPRKVKNLLAQGGAQYQPAQGQSQGQQMKQIGGGGRRVQSVSQAHQQYDVNPMGKSHSLPILQQQQQQQQQQQMQNPQRLP